MRTRGYRVFLLASWFAIGGAINLLLAAVLLNYGLRTAVPDAGTQVTQWAGDWTLAVPDWPPPQLAREDRWRWGDRLLLTYEPEAALRDGIAQGFINDAQEKFVSRRVDRYRAGWPLSSVACWYAKTAAPKPIGTARWCRVMCVNLPGLGDTLIPLWPTWPGFVLNSSIFGVAAWMLWHTPSLMRNIARRVRGHCTRCGYDRTGIPRDAPCPECGHTARAQS